MALAAGTRLGAYEILTLLGSGGMGAVYLAHDSKLGRDVALKILPATVTDDPDRVARFRREAQVLASLNHPHIAQIYDLVEADNTQFLVLELVDGESLDKRIARGKIPVVEALGIAKQIAEALEAAHGKGIIHRDLKPANIALTRDRQVKVLDFGLAKAMEPGHATPLDLANSPTMTSPAMMTSIGMILGTAAYMSPEQARGFPVDKRADVWAFGCVLYEMMMGRQAFAGPTVSDTIAAILERDPAFELLSETTPPAIRRLLGRCLAKDLNRRLRDIGDARIEIDDAVAGTGEDKASTRNARWNPAIPLAALVFTVIGAGLLGWSLRPASENTTKPTVRRLAVVPTEPLADVEETLALSPDGHSIAYIAGNPSRRIYVRDIDQYESTPIAGTDGADGVAFSADGRSLAFLADRKLKTVMLAGGSPIILRDPVLGRGFDCLADGSVLFNPGTTTGIWRVRPNTDDADTVTTPDPHEDQHRFPKQLPDGLAVLYSAFSGGGLAEDQVYVHVLKTGQRHPLVKGIGAQYLPTGHLVYVRGGSVFAMPFDPVKLQPKGSPVMVLDGVRQSPAGTPQMSVSRDGTMVYVSSGARTRDRTLVWVDRGGAEEPAAVSERPVAQPRLSPDGHRVAVVAKGDPDVWQVDLTRGAWTRLTFDGSSSFPLWTFDGRHLTFSSGKAGPYTIYWRMTDGSGAEERLLAAARSSYPLSWSADGRLLAFVSLDSQTAQDIWLLDAAPGAGPRRWLQSPFREGAPVFSPDDRWLAYVSDESGRPEIYIRPVAGGQKLIVSAGGGTEPVWPRKSRELFYRNGSALMAADVMTSGPTAEAGKPRRLFEGAYERSTAFWANYDADADGQRFLMIKGQQSSSAPAEIRVVVDWFEELKARVPAK
jgi:eukaryotic-like serine/threonine-protein kinase